MKQWCKISQGNIKKLHPDHQFVPFTYQMQLTTHSSYWCCSSDTDSSHLQPKDECVENNRAEFNIEMKRWVSIAEIHNINMAKMAKYQYGKNGIIWIWQRGNILLWQIIHYINMAKMAKYQYGKNGIILIWQRGEYIIMANNTLYQYGQNGIQSLWIKMAKYKYSNHGINKKNGNHDMNENMAIMT